MVGGNKPKRPGKTTLEFVTIGEKDEQRPRGKAREEGKEGEVLEIIMIYFFFGIFFFVLLLFFEIVVVGEFVWGLIWEAVIDFPLFALGWTPHFKKKSPTKKKKKMKDVQKDLNKVRGRNETLEVFVWK